MSGPNTYLELPVPTPISITEDSDSVHIFITSREERENQGTKHTPNTDKTRYQDRELQSSQWAVMAHTFKPSIWEEEAGRSL